MPDTPSAPFMDGWHAHKIGAADDNPYAMVSQSWSHRQWASGWGKRRDAVQYDQPLTYDDNEGWV